MPQLLLFVLLLAVAVVAAYFYFKRAQRRTGGLPGDAAGEADAPAATARED
jgi:cobalamin synthase